MSIYQPTYELYFGDLLPVRRDWLAQCSPPHWPGCLCAQWGFGNYVDVQPIGATP